MFKKVKVVFRNFTFFKIKKNLNFVDVTAIWLFLTITTFAFFQRFIWTPFKTSFKDCSSLNNFFKCRDPTVGPEPLTLFLSTLYGKRGIITLSP